MILVIRNFITEGLGYFEEVLKKYSLGFRYIDANHLREDNIYNIKVSIYSGIIILGGPQSVYEEDKYPYLKFEKMIIEKFLQKNSPVLGICLGSQILANMLGARVYKGDRGEEIGWYDIQITGDGAKDPIFSKYYPNLKVFQWHGDTFDLPKDCVRIATSDKYLNQAFRYKQNVYALQFHVETRKEDAKLWCESSGFPETKTSEILKEFDIYFDTAKNVSDNIIWNLFINNLW